LQAGKQFIETGKTGGYSGYPALAFMITLDRIHRRPGDGFDVNKILAHSLFRKRKNLLFRAIDDIRGVFARFKRFLLGTDYRKLWTAPLEAEVLDLGSFAGGLTPVMRVGGQQSKGLALKGADGRDYTFRGVDKAVGEFWRPVCFYWR